MTDKLTLSYSDDFEKDYKIAGLTIFAHFDHGVISRSTYDTLAFLGDVGGLEGILVLIGGMLISPITSFLLTFILMPFLYISRDAMTSGEDEKLKSL